MRRKVQILSISSNPLGPEIERAFKPYLEDWQPIIREVLSVKEAVEFVASVYPDLVFIDHDGNNDANNSFCREVAILSPKTQVIATYRLKSGDTDFDSKTLLEGVRSGIKDFIRRPVSSKDISQALSRLPKIGSQNRSSGKIITLVSNKGGVGKSTLAVNLACSLAKDRPGEVLLIDTSIQLGSLQFMLDIKNTMSLADVIKEEHRLDETLLRRLVEQHESGLHLIPAPETATDSANINDQSLSRVLNVAKKAYSYVVVDTFPMVDGLVISCLDISDEIVIVLEGVVPTVLGCHKLLQLLKELGYPSGKIRVALNRYSSFSGNLSPDMIEEKLGHKLDYILPYTRESLIAMNLGKPLVVNWNGVGPNQLFRTIPLLSRLPFLKNKQIESKFVNEVARMAEHAS